MGYEFTFSITMAVGAVLAIVLGLFITLLRLRDWVVKQINKNKPVKVFDYRNGKQYKYSFATVREAAVFALKRKASGKGVAYLEVEGKTIWHSQKDKQSLVALAKE